MKLRSCLNISKKVFSTFLLKETGCRPSSATTQLNLVKIIECRYKILWPLSILLSCFKEPLSYPPPSDLSGNQQKVIQVLEALFQEDKHEEVCRQISGVIVLRHSEQFTVELLWRFSRSLYKMAVYQTTCPIERECLIKESYYVIRQSMLIDDTSFHNNKWMSVSLDAKSAFDGPAVRIKRMPEVKMYLLRALNEKPRDSTTLYLLGHWCYQIADIPWYQRQIAALLFAEFPHSTYEEALFYLTKAEEAEPRFYCGNLLLLGKICIKLNKFDRAQYYLDLAKNYSICSVDDIEASRKATEELNSLKTYRILARVKQAIADVIM